MRRDRAKNRTFRARSIAQWNNQRAKNGVGGYRIVEHNCAIWAVAQKYGQACTSEIEFIRTVLPGTDVERVQHMIAGARRCAYEVRALDAA